MQTFGAFIVSLIAAGGMVAAVPTESKTASVQATYNSKHIPHGPTALLKAYRKYGVPPSDQLVTAAATKNVYKRQTGSVVTDPSDSFDSEYITQVSIGSPGQSLPLDFDTGSSDLWVFSSETPKAQAAGHKIWNIGQSKTAKELSGYSWSILYGDHSSSSGNVYTDSVTVGGFTVKTQAVESATKVSAQFTEDTSNSGLLGLAFDVDNTVKPVRQKTWFSNAQSSLKAPLFTANLKHQADGTYNFGFIDSSEFRGPINYVPVDNSQGFWGFTASGYSVNGKHISNSSISGIADTGTTLLLLPDSIVSSYYSRVGSAKLNDQLGGYVFSCSERLPDFSFGVGSGSITIAGELMNYAPADSAYTLCFGGLQSSSDIGINIFGDIALKAAVVVFDAGNHRLGWAQK
ncbi:Endothiapepsin [Escovopsis weberi]|uniref:Endothiapepsin n=1 Tax=Escovopsis weberi TaxID=150374 RepID=A0A0M8N6T4_ESCWE|nr:Endothiapepsin [Escovopsis weberi]